MDCVRVSEHASESWVFAHSDAGAGQAHMIREFQDLAGSATSALWRRGLPDAGGFVD
jgi:hypothetical protein